MARRIAPLLLALLVSASRGARAASLSSLSLTHAAPTATSVVLAWRPDAPQAGCFTVFYRKGLGTAVAGVAGVDRRQTCDETHTFELLGLGEPQSATPSGQKSLT